MLERGALVVLVGKPNVGKSSLLNSILSEERTIVSDAPGTTRDAVEAPFLINGFPVRFVDTAGFRDPDSAVEQKGLDFSVKYIERADLVINLFDATENNREPLEKDLFSPLSSTVPRINVFNKSDLLTKSCNHKTNSDAFFVSALTGDGVALLLEAVYNNLMGASILSNHVIINSSRHHNILRRVRSCLEATEAGLKCEDPLDVVASDLRISVSILDELLGVTTADDILNNIFSKFCIGK
jgi:tRNA modification GTPase